MGLTFARTVIISHDQDSLSEERVSYVDMLLPRLSESYGKTMDAEHSQKLHLYFHILIGKRADSCLKLTVYRLRLRNGETENLLCIVDRGIDCRSLRGIGLGDYLLQIVDGIAASFGCKWIWTLLVPSDEYGYTNMENLVRGHVKRGYQPASAFFSENTKPNVYCKMLT